MKRMGRVIKTPRSQAVLEAFHGPVDVNDDRAGNWPDAAQRLIGLATIGLAALSSPGQSPVLSPGQNFDLSHWSLTLPDPHASVISPLELAAGLTNQYFYTCADGGMVFRCPVTGGTTSGSSFPRCELREMLDPWDNRVNWSPYGTHILSAQCRVLRVPSTGRVVIGQIHCYLGGAPPLVKLEFNDGVVLAAVKLVSTVSSDTRFPMAEVELGEDIHYQIGLANGEVILAVNGVTQSLNVFATDPAWADQTYYFKAGNYCQDNFGTPEEESTVSFAQLSVEHVPPCVITNISATDGNFCLTWTSLPGCWYFVQGASSLNDLDWLTLSPVLTATNSLTSYCIARSSARQFLRVEQRVPQPPVRLSGRHHTNGFLLEWRSAVATRYSVQWTETLPPVWNTFANPVTSTNGRYAFFENGPGAGGIGAVRFYRVMETP